MVVASGFLNVILIRVVGFYLLMPRATVVYAVILLSADNLLQAV